MMQRETQKSLLNDLFVRGDKSIPENFMRRIFRLITLPNGTTKNTWPGRLDELNTSVQPHLTRATPLEIKDIAVSSGISTLEWAHFLNKNNVSARITATDLYVSAYLVRVSPSLSVLCDGSLEPMLIESGKTYFRTSFPKGSLRRYWGKILSKAVRALWIGNAAPGEKTGKGKTMTPVELIVPGIKKEEGISFMEEDILADPPAGEISKYDVIRAANILNRVYFSESNLRKIISNLAEQLKPGGLLVVSKTDEGGTNHASIVVKEENRFTLLEDLNGGSEIRDLILSCTSLPFTVFNCTLITEERD